MSDSNEPTTLQQNEQIAFLKSILESSIAYSIVAYDLDGWIVAWNEGARRIYGYEASEVVGKVQAFILHDPDDVKSGHAQKILDTARNEGKWEGEVVRVRKNGTRFTAHVTITLRRDPSGKAMGFTMISRDLTHEQEIETELRKSREYGRSLVESNIYALITASPNPAIIYTRRAGGDYDVTFVSENVSHQLGFEPRDFEENPSFWTDRIHPDDKSCFSSELGRIFESRIHTVEYRFQDKFQSYRRLFDQWTVIRDASGQPIQIMGACVDITHQKITEEKLSAYAGRLKLLSSRRMKAQETERRRIARALHDDVGQALVAVKMNLQAMEELPEAAAIPMVQPLSESAEIVEKIINQIRDLSRDLHPTMLDDLGLAAALRWQVDRHAQRAGIASNFIADPSLARNEPAVEISCFRVAQEALTNIVKHAKARRVSVELRRRGMRLEMTIRDDGVGFDVEAAWKKVSEGESFGLLSMEERVSAAGGRIEIRSVPGSGTEVRAEFPLNGSS